MDSAIVSTNLSGRVRLDNNLGVKTDHKLGTMAGAMPTFFKELKQF